MALFIIIFFVFVVLIIGMIFGCAFLVKMYNSDKQKDREWAIKLLNRKKKHGTL